jgi:type IV pilus assembly protein PilB
MYDNQALFTILKELQVIDEKELTSALADATNRKIPLGNVLLDKDLITDTDLGKLIAQILKLPFVILANIAIPTEILTIIPELIAKQQRIIAFKKDEHGLHVAMENPNNLEIIQFLQTKLGISLIIYYATQIDIEKALNLYTQEIGKAFEQLMQEFITSATGKDTEAIDPPIIKIVETIISYASKNNASDIHIEPQNDSTVVRFRIDGNLHDVITLSSTIYSEIVRRIKVLARMRTDESQAPQDGKIEFEFDEHKIDVRVSTVPVRKGEKIVMRLLSDKARQISLLSLGISENDLIKIENAYNKPFGAILATGPTGSGKTTTMYAILKLLNNRDVNIMTIEDPIEYDVEGINQMQVNQKEDVSFATGLRSILRQDPNIILVGEIRDQETADIAVNAAMTGHLVLSTLHTNDATTAIPRLIDMGIEPFLIASTVTAIVAQRLVRKIHTVCRVSEDVPRVELMKYLSEIEINKYFGTEEIVRLYKGKGCDLCHHSSYDGRMGIFEILVIDDEIKHAIIDKQDATTIRKFAQKKGMRTMLEDGIEKAIRGETTISEVLRVSKE